MEEAEAGPPCCGKKPLWAALCFPDDEVDELGVRWDGRLSLRSVSDDVDLEHSVWLLS